MSPADGYNSGDGTLNWLFSDGLGLTEITIIMLAMFAGGFCKGVIGVALPLVGISIMVLLIDAKLAVAMIVIPIVLTNFQMAMRSDWAELFEALKRFWPLILTCFVSLLSVAVFAGRLSSSTILLGLGIALIIFVLANVSPWKPRISPRLEKPAGALVGVVSGVLGGATSVYGPPITMFLLASGVQKSKWLASIGTTFSIGSLPLVAGYTINGLITPNVAVVSTLACAPAFFGMWLGFKLQDAMAPDTFRKVLMTGLFLMALNLVRKGLL
jgi:uncharacterized membrane protein YfcA